METIYNPSSLRFDALRQLIKRMEAVMTNEEDVTSASLLGVLQEWLDAPTRIDSGSLSPYPKSEEYIKAMTEAERAIHSLYAHIQSLDGTVRRSKEEHKTDYERLNGLMGRLQNLYVDVESLVFAKDRVRTSSEFFLSDANIDYGRIGGKALRVESGTVSLPYATSPVIMNQKVKAMIIPGVLTAGEPILGTESNGFAGNNHEVRVIASDIASGVDEIGHVTFIGEEDRNADLSAILDQDATSWFEYEKIDMRETEQVLLAQGKNLAYEIAPGKVEPYIGKPEGGLKLHLLLTLQEASLVNEIELSTYVPPNYGATEAMIEDILISDGTNPPTSVFERKPLAGEKIFRFAPRQAKSIQIKFAQARPYPFDYGHIYYEQLTPTKGQSVFFDKAAGRMKAKNPLRVEGPLQPITDMGYVVKEEKTGIRSYYGEQAYGEVRAQGVSRTMQKSLSEIDPTKVKMGVQKIEALRYAIGIRDILIKEAVYETEGELITKPHYYDEPVERITIETDAVMEEDAKSQGANVFYFVSVDDGAEWLPIAPVNSNQDRSIPRIYRVGQTEEDTEMPVIETTAPVYALRFKVVMSIDGVRTQANDDSSYRSPQLFSYQAKIETKETPRDTRIPKLAMPIMPKGTSGEFNYVPSDSSELTRPPEATPPKVSISTLPDWCQNKPMQLPVVVEAQEAITKVEVYIDGELLLAVTPNTLKYSETLSVPVNLFETKSRVSVMVKAYVGSVASSGYGYVRIIPCEDGSVQEKQIVVDALDLSIEKDWVIAGVANSDESIVSTQLTIQGQVYNLKTEHVIGLGTKKTELQLTIPYEEWKTFGFTVGEEITVTWTATGENKETWQDNDTVILRDERVVPKVTQKIKHLRFSYFNWDTHTFNEVLITDFQNKLNRVVATDGRGVDLLVGWSKKEGRPVFMTRSGIGETGGIIIGSVSMLIESGTVPIEYAMVQSHKEHECSMLEKAVDTTPAGLSYTGQLLRMLGDLSTVARLERLNSWFMPRFSEEAEAGLTADSIECEAFEPEDHLLKESDLPPREAVCSDITGFFYQRYNRIKGQFTLHYKHGSGNHAIEDGATLLAIDIGYHVDPAGVALTLRGEPANKLYLTALGVMRKDQQARAIYGQVYVGSQGYDKKDENGLYLGEPKKDAYWIDDISNRGDDTEAPGLRRKGSFLHLAVDGTLPYCGPLRPWKDAFGYDLYDTVAPVLTLEPATKTMAWQSLEADETNPSLRKLPYLAKLIDDRGLGEIDLYVDGVLVGELGSEELEAQLQGVFKLEPIIETEVVPGQSVGQADILFTIDTSGSMGNIISDVITKLNELKSEFTNSSVDIQMAAVGTNYDNIASYSQVFKQASEFTMNIGLDSGGFEGMQYEQIDVQAGSRNTPLRNLLPKRRANTRLYHFIVTDTYMGSGSSTFDIYGQAQPFTQIIDANIAANVSISVSSIFNLLPKYEEMTKPTGGINTTNDQDFKVVFQDLLKKIEDESVSTYKERTVTIQAIGYDAGGNRVETTHVITLKDEKNIEGAN